MKKKILLGLSLLITASIGLTSCGPEEDTSSSSSSDTSSSTSSSSSSSGDGTTTYPTDAYGNYYNNCLSWTNGEDLKIKLSTAIHDGFTAQKYDGIWTTNQNADQALDNWDMVDQIYSEDDILKIDFKGSGNQAGWDREHAFPKSLISSDTSTSSPGPLTDFHNLYAAWTTGNNSRGNKNLGNVSEPTGTVGINKYTETTFEPGNSDDKGKTARSIFYMATMYTDLSLREETCGTGSKCHGNLSSLLEWNLNSVTQLEYQHNLAVLAYQFNRNPYVDYPGLVDYVFGSKQNQAGELKYLEPSVLKLNWNSKTLNHYAVENGRYEYLVGDAFSKNDFKIIGVDGGLKKTSDPAPTFTLSGITDGQVFTEVGIKTATITIGSQMIKYPVNVSVDPVSKMSWTHKFDATDFKGGNNPGVVNTVTLSGTNWTEYRANSAATHSANSKTQGVQVGSSSASVNSMIFTSSDAFSYDSKTLIKEIAFEGSVASGTTATLVFKVDGVQIGTSMTVKQNSSGRDTFIATLDEPTSGVVSIEITGIAKALWVYRIGVTVE